ncbi:iron ABC transporter permease [Candidatus Bathyarchaeota archaeon]|nr:iron ABC transporter permease [Candidatus Bathyarchaeota archaeon]
MKESKSIGEAINRLSGSPIARKILYSFAVFYLIAFILLPPLLGISFKLDLIDQVFRDEILLNRAKSAIMWSFTIAFIIAILDLIAGIPMAWIIARGKSNLINILDAFVDIPFVIPTVALGFSTLLFWNSNYSPLKFLGVNVSPGFFLILLLHFAFSFPVIVRVMVGELLTYKDVYENAAKSLGAKSFTVARTVTLPILKPGLVAAFLLAFARSLSETGATMIVAGAFENGPIFIKNAKDAGLEGPMVLVSFILIIASITVFGIIRILGTKFRIPIGNVYPDFEALLSKSISVKIRNVLTITIFIFLVFIPSIFITSPVLGAISDGTLVKAISGEGIWSSFWNSMILSYTIGIIATLINVITGFPVAILIARKRLGHIGSILLEAAVNVPIVVPSVALGVSLGFFWRTFSFLSEFWIIIFAHTTITYTYFVQAMAAAIEGIPEEMEETARTLGSKALGVFKNIIVPLTKYSIFSGAILMFTRSVDETGATTAVSQKLQTAPVLLVNWIKGIVPATTSDIALGISFLVLTSFISLLVLRLVVYRRR